MKKRLLLTLVFAGIIGASASAQSFYIDLNYQSFRPFIHFQLHIGDRRTRFNSYQSSYMKGYLDGVNSTHYADYRFYDLVRQIDAYEAGYRDGQQDQQLYCQLHGYRRLPHRRFSYNDYYSPQIAVQIWLNDLTFTFLRAPSHRLPHSWARHARPAIIRYRRRFKDHKYLAHIKKRYRNSRKRLKKRANATHVGHRKKRSRPRRINKSKAIQRIRHDVAQRSNAKRNRIKHIRTKRNKPKQVNRRPSQRSPIHKTVQKKVRHRHSSSTKNRAKHTRRKRPTKHTKSDNRHRSRRGHRN